MCDHVTKEDILNLVEKMPKYWVAKDFAPCVRCGRMTKDDPNTTVIFEDNVYHIHCAMDEVKERFE